MASKKLPYYKMYPADADTDENFRAMTMEERGFYLCCLNHAWVNYGLPNDPEERARVFNLPQVDHDRLWKRVGRCFVVRGERVVNTRQELERSEAIGRSAHARRAATVKHSSSSVRAEVGQSAGTPREVLRASESDSVSESVVSSEGGAGGNPPNFEFSDWFERQYSRHPRKKNRILAEQAAVSAFSAGEFTLEDFERRHVAWCASEEWRWKNGARAPDLASWIGDKGFRYDPPEESQAADEPDELERIRQTPEFKRMRAM